MKIKIAVAIGSNESWSANGWNGATDQSKRDCALEMIDETEEVHVVWVTADVPVPEKSPDLEVDGEVEVDE